MKLSFLLPCDINSTPNEYYDDIKEAFNFWQPVLLEQKNRTAGDCWVGCLGVAMD